LRAPRAAARYRRGVRLGRLFVALLTAGLLSAAAASSSAQGTTTTQEPIGGLLLAVGPAGRSLTVSYTDAGIQGCGLFGVAPAVAETAASVSVTLTATVGVLPPGVSCADDLVGGTVVVPLAAPLAGRAVDGLALQGGAFDWYGEVAAPTIPSLVGLSPLDARLMLSPPPGTPGGEPFGFGPVALVDHTARHAGARALATVVAQKPAPGTPLRRGMIVVLTVAR
jgi:hypothetical protein